MLFYHSVGISLFVFQNWNELNMLLMGFLRNDNRIIAIFYKEATKKPQTFVRGFCTQGGT
jgi:hypothetical protein